MSSNTYQQGQQYAQGSQGRAPTTPIQPQYGQFNPNQGYQGQHQAQQQPYQQPYQQLPYGPPVFIQQYSSSSPDPSAYQHHGMSQPVPLPNGSYIPVQSHAANPQPDLVYSINDQGQRRSPRKPAPEVGPVEQANKPEVTTKAKGKGGRKKKPLETSDDEIAKADQSLLNSFALNVTPEVPSGVTRKWTDEENLNLVEWVVLPENWKDIKMCKKRMLERLHKKGLIPTKDVKAMINKWDSLWKLYKAVKAREEHTGGGDGDEDREPSVDSESDSNDDEGVDGHTLELGPAEEKPVSVPKVHVGKAKKETFSIKQIKNFTLTPLYNLIDGVAGENPDIVRKTVFSSTKKIEEDDDKSVRSKASTQKRKRSTPGSDSDTAPDPVDRAIALISQRHAETSRFNQETLELAKRREEREEAAAEAQRKREDAEEARRLATAKKEQINAMYALYERYSASDKPLLLKKAEALMNEIEAAEAEL